MYDLRFPNLSHCKLLASTTRTTSMKLTALMRSPTLSRISFQLSATIFDRSQRITATFCPAILVAIPNGSFTSNSNQMPNFTIVPNLCIVSPDATFLPTKRNWNDNAHLDSASKSMILNGAYSVSFAQRKMALSGQLTTCASSTSASNKLVILSLN
jgi:hypothetical protein